jgi:hypothetical protein
MLKDFGVRKSATDLWDWLVDNYDEFIRGIHEIEDLVGTDAAGKDRTDLFEDLCDALEKLKEASRGEAENYKETVRSAARNLSDGYFCEAGVATKINKNSRLTHDAGGMIDKISTLQ